MRCVSLSKAITINNNVKRTMRATHELVVPKSIPITSPASVLFHRCEELKLKLLDKRMLLLLPTLLDGDCNHDDVDRSVPRRNPSCSAIVIVVVY